MHVYTQRGYDMTRTRIFRNGNSQAVRIPAELAYERSDSSTPTCASTS